MDAKLGITRISPVVHVERLNLANRTSIHYTGTAVVTGFQNIPRLVEVILRGAWVSRKGGKRIGMMDTVRSNKQDLMFLVGLIDAGKIKTVIDRCYPLDETAKALRYLETGRARGKVIINMNQ